jgi:hypothetical protein
LQLEIERKAATICGKKHPFQSNLDPMPVPCKHPRVRVVSRHDDAEFVECLECGEVFDSEEFNDIAIEESAENEEAEPEEDE